MFRKLRQANGRRRHRGAFVGPLGRQAARVGDHAIHTALAAEGIARDFLGATHRRADPVHRGALLS